MMRDPFDARVERAKSAYSTEPWSDAQHRSLKLRLQKKLPGSAQPSFFSSLGGRNWVLAAAGVAVLLLAGSGARSLLFGPEGRVAIPGPAPAASASSILAEGSYLGDPSRETRGIFRDGSAMHLQPASRVRVLREHANETRLELVSGRAAFDVQKHPGRAFIALAMGVEVWVLGTRFELELDESRGPSRVRISVQSGVVEVRQSAGALATRLAAGQTLELSTAGSPPAREAPQAPPASAAVPSGQLSAAPSLAASSQPDAISLFKAASAARASGQINEAVRLYAALLERFPRDERVGLAALELGRLRLDAQRDPARAVTAFRRAVLSAPNEGLREDASARLVEALDAMNRADQCQTERSRYLARYPRGVHAAAVRGRCAGR